MEVQTLFFSLVKDFHIRELSPYNNKSRVLCEVKIAKKTHATIAMIQICMLKYIAD